MWFINKDNVFENLLWCFLRFELQGVNGHSTLMNPLRVALPRPVLLEYATGSDVSIVVKYDLINFGQISQVVFSRVGYHLNFIDSDSAYRFGFFSMPSFDCNVIK